MNDTNITEQRPPKKSFMSGRWHLALCFALPVFILFVIYLFMQVFPFGENSVLVLDLNGQYVYFFEQLRRIVTEGGSFLYSFSRALGGEFMGIFSYYLASPLSFIVALFPKENITEALFVLILLKCGLCGLTFGIFSDATRRLSKVLTVTFSAMYALSAFCVVMQHNVMWTDCIFLLPLVMLGIRRMISTGSMTLYVTTLAPAVLSNFYIGYMMCIFSALYFFYAYFSMDAEERNPYGVKSHFLKSALRMFLASLTAACIAAVIILPTWYSLEFGKTTFSDPSFDFLQKFDFADALSKLYFGTYDTVRPEGLPFLFTSTLTLITAPLYFISKKVSLKEKISSAVLVLVFAVSMNSTTIDIFWHGMQKPNWLNYRYTFMLVFFFILFSSRALEDLKDTGIKPVLITSAFAATVLIILQKIGYDNMPDLECVWASLGFIAVYLIILKFAVSDKKATRETASAVMAIVVCFELFASGLLNLYSLDNDVSFSSRTGYRTYIDKMQTAVDDIKASDSGFYRTEITDHRKTNDNMALGIYGLSGSTSTLNAETIKFLNRMGFASKSHWSKYLGQTPVSDSLLAVKHIIYNADEDAFPLYRKTAEYEEYGIASYENPYALSLAFGVSEKYLNCPFTDDTATPSPLDKTDLLVGYMTGESESAGIFDEINNVVKYSSNLTETVTAGHEKYQKKDSDSAASLSYNFTPERSGPVFCYFPSSYSRECDLFVNGDKIGTYFGNETCRIINLGIFEAGSNVTVKLELKKDDLFIKEDCAYFRTFDEEAFTESFEKLSECLLNVTEFTDDTVKGNINIKEGFETVFTSVAYDEGWKVYCDGERVETKKALDALITFTLEPGEHELTFEYSPDCVKLGGLISIAGLAAFALITAGNELLVRKARKKREIELKSALSPEELDGSYFDTEPLSASATAEESSVTPPAAAEEECVLDAFGSAESDIGSIPRDLDGVDTDNGSIPDDPDGSEAPQSEFPNGFSNKKNGNTGQKNN